MQLPDTLKPLYSADDIAARIAELGAQITLDYAGRDLVLVGVLKGAFPFLADLCRQIDLPVSVDFLGLSSYGGRTESSGVVRLTRDLSQPIEGREVLLIEDIVDTGLTIRYVMENFETRRPASVAVCSLLDKPAGRRTEVSVKYVGFTVPNHFVVGYGLDLEERYRNLPHIAYFDPPSSARVPDGC